MMDIDPSICQLDVTDEAKAEEILNNHKIDGVICFAVIKTVRESDLNQLSSIY